MLNELGSQDIRIAISNSVNSLFPDSTIYTEHLSSSPAFPHFHVLLLQVNRRQASRMQVRDEWDKHNVFFTIKHRLFDGNSIPPENLLARLHNVGYRLISGMRVIQLNNTRYRIYDSYYELEAERDVGLMCLGFYANVDVLIKIPAEPHPLQNTLEYNIKSDSVRSGAVWNDERHNFKKSGVLRV